MWRWTAYPQGKHPRGEQFVWAGVYSLQLQEIGLCNQHNLMKSAILKCADHKHLTEEPKQEDHESVMMCDDENVAKYL